jgi:hypothetical protein
MPNKPTSSSVDKIELPLASDPEIIDVVIRFENCTLPIEHWTHRAHLAIAVAYVRTLNQKSALDRIRDRINLFNQNCGDPNGYNETVTRMFIRKLASEIEQGKSARSMHEEVERLSHLCRVEWLYHYFSKQRIWSDEAKANWIEPDLNELDF